jgi:hypothetical protein
VVRAEEIKGDFLNGDTLTLTFKGVSLAAKDPYLQVCACVCVRERERERERFHACVCVCTVVCAWVCAVACACTCATTPASPGKSVVSTGAF